MSCLGSASACARTCFRSGHGISSVISILPWLSVVITSWVWVRFWVWVWR
jgi:hypothetical protein